MGNHVTLDSRPVAAAKTVEDLVELVLKGSIRIPAFQRDLKWDASDVLLLFDSVYRGYPVGSLLFLKRFAEAERLVMGPLTIHAEELSDAWWVVDGQQRLTTLAAALARPEPFPKKALDPYVVYFDPKKLSFEKPPRSGAISPHWVPVSLLLDSSRLAEWVFTWEFGRDDGLRRVVFDAGKRIREYSLPLYVIETTDEDVPRQIFDRVNNAGKKIDWTDVHKALFGSSASHPASLRDLAEDLGKVGMGQMAENRLLSCLVAFRGLDVTQNPGEHFRKKPELLKNAVKDAAPVLRRVLSFLRHDAGVPHLELLPESSLLDVLTRFFTLHPEPSPRVRMLLSRWLWRIFLGAGLVARPTLRRRGVGEIQENDEEESVQYLLSLVGKDQPPYPFPDRFDARAANSRIVLLAIASRSPRHLLTGEPMEIAELMGMKGKGILTFVGTDDAGRLARGASNRTLHPLGINLRKECCERFQRSGLDPVINSHCLDLASMEALEAGNAEAFLVHRSQTLTMEVARLGKRMAAWGQSDRPSISHLLAQAS